MKKNNTGKRIPISAVQDIAKKYGYTQVIVHGYDGETGSQCVATYGVSLTDCANAAEGGNVLKKLLGFPDELCQAKPKRVAKKTAKQIFDDNCDQQIIDLGR